MCTVFNNPQFANRCKIENPFEVPAHEAVEVLNQHGACPGCDGRSQRIKIRPKGFEFDIAIAHLEARLSNRIWNDDTRVARHNHFIPFLQAKGFNTR